MKSVSSTYFKALIYLESKALIESNIHILGKMGFHISESSPKSDSKSASYENVSITFELARRNMFQKLTQTSRASQSNYVKAIEMSGPECTHI